MKHLFETIAVFATTALFVIMSSCASKPRGEELTTGQVQELLLGKWEGVHLHMYCDPISCDPRHHFANAPDKHVDLIDPFPLFTFFFDDNGKFYTEFYEIESEIDTPTSKYEGYYSLQRNKMHTDIFDDADYIITFYGDDSLVLHSDNFDNHCADLEFKRSR